VGLEDDFTEDHPAHPQHLPNAVRSLICGVNGQPPLVGLAPGVALDWDALIHDRLKTADFLDTTNNAIKNTQDTIGNQRKIMEKLTAQLKSICAAELSGKVTATAGVQPVLLQSSLGLLHPS
jgi:hypothetical protein